MTSRCAVALVAECGIKPLRKKLAVDGLAREHFCQCGCSAAAMSFASVTTSPSVVMMAFKDVSLLWPQLLQLRKDVLLLLAISQRAGLEAGIAQSLHLVRDAFPGQLHCVLT